MEIEPQYSRIPVLHHVIYVVSTLLGIDLLLVRISQVSFIYTWAKNSNQEISLQVFFSTVHHIKGTISDSLGLRKIFKPFRNKEKYLSNLQHVPFFLKKSHIKKKKKKKRLFIRFHCVGPSTVFLHRKISINFRINFCASLSIEHIKPLSK